MAQHLRQRIQYGDRKIRKSARLSKQRRDRVNAQWILSVYLKDWKTKPVLPDRGPDVGSEKTGRVSAQDHGDRSVCCKSSREGDTAGAVSRELVESST
jgi:hypothetical protein